VTRQSQQVRQLADAREVHVPGQLDRRVPVPVLQVEFDGLREARQVVDAEHHIVAGFAQESQHRGI